VHPVLRRALAPAPALLRARAPALLRSCVRTPAFMRTHPAHAQPTECAAREVNRSTRTSGRARPQGPRGVTSNPKVADKRFRKVSDRCFTRTIIEELKSEGNRLDFPRMSETGASARADCARAVQRSCAACAPTAYRTRAVQRSCAPAPRPRTVHALSNAVAHTRPAAHRARGRPRSMHTVTGHARWACVPPSPATRTLNRRETACQPVR